MISLNLNINEIIEGLEYKVICVIQHGSTVMGFAEKDSDYDFLVVVDGVIATTDREIPLVIDNTKIHLSLLSQDEFEKKINNFYSELLVKVLDVNLLAGRLRQGKIVYDTDNYGHGILSTIIHDPVPIYVIEKYIWQCYGFIKDARHSNQYIKQNCIEKAIDSWGIAVLLKNSISTLNIKWQPLLLKNILPPNIYSNYLTLRFNYINQNSDDVNKLLKTLIDYSKR